MKMIGEKRFTRIWNSAYDAGRRNVIELILRQLDVIEYNIEDDYDIPISTVIADLRKILNMVA